MIETVEEFNAILIRLRNKRDDNKLSRHMDSLLDGLEEVEELIKNLSLGGVVVRYSFAYKEPEIGAIINMVWENGSDCQCVYDGKLDKTKTPLPYAWYYS